MIGRKRNIVFWGEIGWAHVKTQLLDPKLQKKKQNYGW